jgi:hypothetical protein
MELVDENGEDIRFLDLMSYVNQTLHMVEVSESLALAVCFNSVIFNRKFLVGDGIVLWRTWAVLGGRPIVYFPIILWITAISKSLLDKHLSSQ